MIEEIKKEIWKIREKTFTKKDKEGHMCNEWVDCLSFNDDILPLIKILDKYNNQEKQTTIFIDTEDMEERYGTQLYIEYLEKYKNAWEELKEGYETKAEVRLGTYLEIQRLEQKYNLVSIVERGNKE